MKKNDEVAYALGMGDFSVFEGIAMSETNQSNAPIIPVMKGRREIVTDVDVITAENLLDELVKALNVHEQNRIEIQYLWNYYRGEQPILWKVKEVRPEISNKIVVNRANEIVTFKTGYLAGEPITYVSTGDDEEVMKNIKIFNDAMYTLGKQQQDRDLVEWDMICGTAYRYISTEKVGDVPFKTYTLDPRNTFVVYSSDISHKRKFACHYWFKTGGVVQVPVVGDGLYHDIVFEVFTENRYFRVEDGRVVKEEPNYLGAVNIVEYKANNARQGAFEIVLPLLDALNACYSDRLDSVDSFVQAFMKFINCDIDAEGVELLKEYGAIKIKSEPNLPADVDLVTSELNQDQTETLVSSIDAQINVICGLPNRNGGASTSDTGRAVELRDGFVDCEVRAKASEGKFREADNEALEIIFKICETKHFCSLKVSDVKAQFTRRNYDNLQSKSQVLIAMLQNNKIDPKLAFECSGMFSDPESAYTDSMKYYNEVMEKMQEQMATTGSDPDENSGERTPTNAKDEGTEISNPIVKSATQTPH